MRKFFVTGYGISAEWKADLKVKDGAPVDILGDVEAVRGSMSVLGRNFTIKEGQVHFAGGVKPLLNVVMTTQAKEIEAGLEVTGDVSKPKLELTSTPELPRDDILSYILFGKPFKDLSNFEMLRLGASAASLAAFGGGGGLAALTRQVSGVDVVNISQNDNGDTRLEMGKYVLDKVYVGVEQEGTSSSGTSALIQLELGPKTNANVKSGSNTSVGLQWKHDY